MRNQARLEVFEADVEFEQAWPDHWVQFWTLASALVMVRRNYTKWREMLATMVRGSFSSKTRGENPCWGVSGSIRAGYYAHIAPHCSWIFMIKISFKEAGTL